MLGTTNCRMGVIIMKADQIAGMNSVFSASKILMKIHHKWNFICRQFFEKHLIFPFAIVKNFQQYSLAYNYAWSSSFHLSRASKSLYNDQICTFSAPRWHKNTFCKVFHFLGGTFLNTDVDPPWHSPLQWFLWDRYYKITFVFFSSIYIF